VRLGGAFSSAREFVVVRHLSFGDVRYYVGTRAVGRDLEVLSVIAAEPAWLKHLAARVLSRGAWWSWSLPTGIERSEELRSFLTLVEAAVLEVAKRVVTRATDATGKLGGGNTSVLDQWR
jgi:hypothetical protein